MNFARNKDPKIDAALQQGRSSTDPAVRKQAYATVQRQIDNDSPTSGPTVRIGPSAQNTVRGITNGPSPTASRRPIGGAGDFGGVRFTQTWIAS